MLYVNINPSSDNAQVVNMNFLLVFLIAVLSGTKHVFGFSHILP